MANPQQGQFFGRFARIVRCVFRLFTPTYTCDFEAPQEPVVYVCRHLDMHGPWTTMKWLPCQVHPMILHVFFKRETVIEHMTQYTLSRRYGRKPRRFSPLAHIMSHITPAIMQSMQAIPVYRESIQVTATFREGLKYLCRGESLIIFPDRNYRDGYEKTGEIYDGFLYLGQLYCRKTGRPLQFVPLLIDDARRIIHAGEPVIVKDFRTQRETAAQQLQRDINQ